MTNTPPDPSSTDSPSTSDVSTSYIVLRRPKVEMVPGNPWKDPAINKNRFVINGINLSDRVRKSLNDSFYKSSEKKAFRYLQLLLEAYGPEGSAARMELNALKELGSVELPPIFIAKAEEITTEIINFLGQSFEQQKRTASELKGETVEAVFKLARVGISPNIQKKINEVAGEKGKRSIDQPIQRMQG